MPNNGKLHCFYYFLIKKIYDANIVGYWLYSSTKINGWGPYEKWL